MATLNDPELDRTIPKARPGPIIGGTLLIVLRAAAALVWWISFARTWPKTSHDLGLANDPETAGAVLTILLALGGVWTIFLLLLALLLWRGNNVARVLTMWWMTLSVLLAAVSYITEGAEITIRTTLLTLSLDILVLLALSSRDARAWARRPRPGRRKITQQ